MQYLGSGIIVGFAAAAQRQEKDDDKSGAVHLDIRATLAQLGDEPSTNVPNAPSRTVAILISVRLNTVHQLLPSDKRECYTERS